MSTTRTGAAIAACALVAGGLYSAPAAGADSAPKPRPTRVAHSLVSPLSMAVAPNGTVYVSQNFAGMLTRHAPGQRPRVVFQARKGTEVGAVSLAGRSVRFATTKGPKTALWSMGPGGRVAKLANLGAYEKKNNPDADVEYGFADLDPACAAQVPKKVPSGYTGIVESHPYGTAVKGGTTYVADAAANAILKVNRRGKVSTVAVIPGIPVEVTPESAAASGLPDCTIGLDYVFEAVPTDVERGPHGTLYVSLLPGGPEDGSAGANGAVVSVKIATGRVRTIASGLMSATGLARAGNGDLYVAELFGNQVSRIKRGSGTARPFAKVAMPAAAEWSHGALYVTAGVLAKKPKGTVLKY